MRSLALIVPGQLGTLTGGYGYDRRIVEGLRARRWAVDVRELGGDFPHPAQSALDDARRVLASLPDDTLVVIDGLAFGVMPAQAARESARLRLVALVHHPLAAETGLDREMAAALESSERRALAAARLVIVTSRATAADLSRYDVARDRIAVVEPGTDRAPLSRGSGGASVHLLTIAAVVPRKGYELLLSALAAIPERNWRLTCVGSLERDPPTVARLRQLILVNGLSGRVLLAGERDAPGVAAAYDTADVFVLPTLHEGYGMAVAEALARGLPVISTPTGAIAELLTVRQTADTIDKPNRAGLLVPPGDLQALFAALSQVLGDVRLREQLAEGARRVRDCLPTWDDASARMAEVLARV